MNGARVGLWVHGWLLLIALPVAANADNAPNQDLARCAALSANDARLACYDALSNRPAGAAPATATAAQPAPAMPVPAPPAPAQHAAVPATPTPAAAMPAAPPAANADDAGQFGLSPAQRHLTEVGPKQEQGQIVSLSADRLGHALIVLDSGQTWAVTDDDGWLSNGDKIVIKRAALGSFLMTTTHHHTYRVHRVQ